MHVAPFGRVLSTVRVPWTFNPQPGCWFPAMGIVLELQARGHQVVALSGTSVAATLVLLGVEVRTDEMPYWPPEVGRGPAVHLGQALRRKVHVARAHRDHVAQLREERFDLVLADGFPRAAGFAADAAQYRCRKRGRCRLDVSTLGQVSGAYAGSSRIPPATVVVTIWAAPVERCRRGSRSAM